jgi:hypothetical protein
MGVGFNRTLAWCRSGSSNRDCPGLVRAGPIMPGLSMTSPHPIDRQIDRAFRSGSQSHIGLPQRGTLAELQLRLTHVLVDILGRMSHRVHIVNETRGCLTHQRSPVVGVKDRAVSLEIVLGWRLEVMVAGIFAHVSSSSRLVSSLCLVASG